MILVDKRGWFWIIWHQIGTPSESCDFHTTASGVRVVWKWGKRGGSGLEMGQAGWEQSGNGTSGVGAVWKWDKRGGSGLEMGQAGWEWSGNGASGVGVVWKWG